MIELTPNEVRVLGVLIEKATTTPEQYPLSLNALTSGSNQKNNRDPVLNLSEDDAFTAVEGLREKQLAVRVDAMGSRVHKYRHEAERVLSCGGPSLAMLAELLLRGPQTVGELRGRASRMHAIESLEEAQTRLRAMAEREEPLVKELGPAPGSRANRFMQMLCATAHQVEAAPQVAVPSTSDAGGSLGDRVARLEREVAVLRSALSKLAVSVGEQDPFTNNEGDTSVAPIK
jgi:uncharacterized protein YceH (UPF0502 family)